MNLKQLLDLYRIEACGTWVRDDLSKISEYEGINVCTMDSLEEGFGHLKLMTFRHPMPNQNCISTHPLGPIVMWFFMHY